MSGKAKVTTADAALPTLGAAIAEARELETRLHALALATEARLAACVASADEAEDKLKVAGHLLSTTTAVIAEQAVEVAVGAELATLRAQLDDATEMLGSVEIRLVAKMHETILDRFDIVLRQVRKMVKDEAETAINEILAKRVTVMLQEMAARVTTTGVPPRAFTAANVPRSGNHRT